MVTPKLLTKEQVAEKELKRAIIKKGIYGDHDEALRDLYKAWTSGKKTARQANNTIYGLVGLGSVPLFKGLPLKVAIEVYKEGNRKKRNRGYRF